MNSKIKDLLLLLLAIVFSIALMFSFIELPRWIDTLLQENVGFPGFDQGSGEQAAYYSNIYIKGLHLRWIGYGSLVLVCFFILMGFVTRKSSWAWAGAFVIFLPVFGQFAISMFFLSGLGILRTGWLPFIESGFPVMDLGLVIYIPYWILMWFFDLFNWYAYNFVCWLFMSVGAFLFAWSVFVWLQSRFGGTGVATGWIYKISRHPQYLGWIIWSYGLMLFSMTENSMKKSWAVGTSFPWLIMTMIIVAICMLEELSMKEKYGKQYEEYQLRTPFLLPLPKWFKAILKAPMWLITKEMYPQSRKQIAGITLVYTFIFMAISLIWVNPDRGGSSEYVVVNDTAKAIDSITIEIQNTTERREMYHYFDALGNMGSQATNQLLIYLSDNDPVKREFAADQLGKIADSAAVWPLISALDDEIWRVRSSVTIALSNIGDQRAADPLFELMQKSASEQRSGYYSLMGKFRKKEAWPYLLDGLKSEKWYIRNQALQALVDIDAEKAMPYLYTALKDTNYRVRRKAVYVLLEHRRQETIKPLQQVLNDEDFEVRFYAQQAINLIKKEYKPNY